MATKNQKRILSRVSSLIGKAKKANANNDQKYFDYIERIGMVVEDECRGMPFKRARAVESMWDLIDQELE